MTTIVIILQLIFLEGILSLDNAAVLGAMVAPLPSDRPIPWPPWFRKPGRELSRLLGPQRTAALKVGLLGAYLGRGLMLILAAWVVHNPWLKLLGALYLVKLAAENLGDSGEPMPHTPVNPGDGRFWRVVLAVELADLAFSLDNVVAAVALSDRLPVVMAGVAMGIVMMRFAAGVFTHLVEREPILEPAAYVLVLNIGLVLLLEEFGGIHVTDLSKFFISAGTLALVLAYAHWELLHVFAPALRAVSRLLHRLNRTTDRALQPVAALLSLGILRR